MLPINFLKQLIGLYGNSMQNFVPSYLEAAMDAFQRNQSAVKDAFSGNVFADLAKRNMAMFEDASRALTARAEARPRAARQQRHGPAQGRARRAAGQGRQAEPLTSMQLHRLLRRLRCSSPRRPGAQDLSTATPIAGNWSYAPAADGSEAVFANDTSGSPQLWVRCTRATRRVTISRAGDCRGALLNVWTSSLSAKRSPSTSTRRPGG